MSRYGIVLDTDGWRARVSAAPRGLCGDCTEQGACALHIGGPGGNPEIVTADNRFGARPGDTVELELAGRMELKLSLLVWVVPLIGIVGGAVAGTLLGGRLGVDEDLAVLAGSVLGFAFAFLILRRVDRKATGAASLLPRVARVVQRAPGVERTRDVES